MNNIQKGKSMRRCHRAMVRIRRVWNELDYAQRRLLEIRTGLPLSGPVSQRRDDHQIAMLEELYRLDWQQ
jgi:hypothetical protein